MITYYLFSWWVKSGRALFRRPLVPPSTEPQTPIPTAPPSVLLQPRGVGPERGAEVAGLWPRCPAGEGGGAKVPLSSPLRMPAESLRRSPGSRAEQRRVRSAGSQGRAGRRGQRGRTQGRAGLTAKRARGEGLSPGEGPCREGAWPAPRSLSTPPENFPLGPRAPKRV